MLTRYEIEDPKAPTIASEEWGRCSSLREASAIETAQGTFITGSSS